MTETNKTKTRLIDPDGYRQRAACICIRNEREDEVRRCSFLQKKKKTNFRLDFIDNLSRSIGMDNTWWWNRTK